MNRLDISPDFTVEDIHKIREYNHEMTKNMGFEERKKYYASGANSVMAEIEALRKVNERKVL